MRARAKQPTEGAEPSPATARPGEQPIAGAVDPKSGGEQASDEDLEPDSVLSATAQKLKASENARRRVFLSSKTFEYDLVLEGNWPWAIEALRLVKPRVTRRLESDETLTTPEAQAEAILNAVDGVKGRFAQALTKTLPAVKTAGHRIVVPDYMRQAIEWASQMGQPPGAATQATGAPEPESAAKAAESELSPAPAEADARPPSGT